MKYPLRFMRDGTATTSRVHDVVPVECANPYHARCFEAVTSWAGQTHPRQNKNWHVYLNRDGVPCLLGPLAGIESAQFETGLKRRVLNKIKKES